MFDLGVCVFQFNILLIFKDKVIYKFRIDQNLISLTDHVIIE